MMMVLLASKRSVCLRYQVGALIVKGRQLLSFGYNGPVSGDVHCSDVGCAKDPFMPAAHAKEFCRGAHAEINAIINAAKNGVMINDASMYVTWRPCYSCAKHIVNSSIIKRVVYLTDYDREPESLELFRKVGIDLIDFKTLSNRDLKNFSEMLLNFFSDKEEK